MHELRNFWEIPDEIGELIWELAQQKNKSIFGL